MRSRETPNAVPAVGFLYTQIFAKGTQALALIDPEVCPSILIS